MSEAASTGPETSPGSGDRPPEPGRSWGQRTLLACSTVAVLAMLVVRVMHSDDGFNFLDESFWVIWMRSPFDYGVSVTQFGYIYHPIFELVDGNLRALRVANALINLALGTALGYACLAAFADVRAIGRATTLAISLAIGTATMAVFASGLPTLNYHTLTLQGFMVAITGMLIIEQPDAGRRTRTLGAIVVGMGGWLTLMGKPSSFVALAVLAVLVATLSRRAGLREVGIALVTGMLATALAAIAIDRSIPEFIERVRVDARLLSMSEAGHSMREALRFDHPPLAGIDYADIALWAVAVGLLALIAAGRSTALNALAAIVGVVVVGAAFASGRIELPTLHISPNPQRPYLYLAVPLAMVTWALVRARRAEQRPELRRLVASGVLLLLPLVYAFGSNINYWEASYGAAIFWVLAGVVLVTAPSTHVNRGALTAIGVATILITTTLTAAQYGPYLPEAIGYRPLATLGVNGSRQHVPLPLKRYVESTVRMAEEASFEPGTPLIDLTGSSVGLSVIIGAHPLGRPWISGTTTRRYAKAVLQTAGCERLARAWLLVEHPPTRRALNPSILTGFDIDVDRDFEVAATASRPQFKSSGNPVRDQPRAQSLLRPTRDVADATAACRAARGKLAESRGA